MFLQKPMLGTQLDHSDSLNNPVLDLLMNEGHGDRVNDLSGWGNHGTLHGFDFPPTNTSGWNPGADGIGLNFDGADDHIDCGNNPSLSMVDALTIMVRIKIISANDNDGIITKMNEDHTKSWSIFYFDERIRFFVGNGTDLFNMYSDSSGYADSTFHDLIFTYDGTGYMYIDGIKQSSSITSVIVDSGLPVIIGKKYSEGTCYPINGSIARARILPRAMSAFEVMQTQIDPYGMYQQ